MVAAGVIEVYLREQSMACDVCQYLHYINFSWQETNETLILQPLMNHPLSLILPGAGRYPSHVVPHLTGATV